MTTKTLRAIGTTLAAAMLVAVSSAVGGAAVARTMLSIPAPDGTITGCYKNSNGDARIVESAADCGANETVVTWQQTGPQGPEGPQGEPGPPGSPGGGTANWVCSRCSFTGMELQGEDFSGARLWCSQFDQGQFSEASFMGSELSGANFSASNLSGTDFRGSTLGTRLMCGGTSFDHSDLTGADFSDTIVKGRGSFTESTLEGANFSGMTQFPKGTPAEDRMDILHTNLRNINLSDATLYSAILLGSDLSGATITNAFIDKLCLSTDESLSWEATNLSNVNLLGSRGVPGDCARIGWAEAGDGLGNVIWSNTTCPDGTNSDDNVDQTCEGHWLPLP